MSNQLDSLQRTPIYLLAKQETETLFQKCKEVFTLFRFKELRNKYKKNIQKNLIDEIIINITKHIQKSNTGGLSG